MSMLLTSAFLGMKYAVPIMKQQRSGSIINNASISGSRPSLNLIYSTAKAGMIQMSKGSAMALAQFGVRVNSVSPGQIVTSMTGGGLRHGPDQDDRTDEKLISYFAERFPLRRAGLTEDVAYGVLYLASDESSFVTGHDLLIDSGLSVGKTFDEMMAAKESMRELLEGD
jgi:NAD(P)-dependent dehydrogenase (short-subunit alcohol dehydrogenase family)